MNRPRSTSVLFLLCLAAQVLVAFAPVWHHHEDGDDRPEQCSVCAAVLTSGSGDVPTPDAVVLVAPLVAVQAPAAQADLGAGAHTTTRARGPPAPGAF